MRDVITHEEFQRVLELVQGLTPLIKSSRRLSIALLYLTGLRVSNILKLTYQHGFEIFQDGRTRIPLIKGGEARHLLIESREYLKEFRDDFDRIKGFNSFEDRSHYIFSSPKTPEKVYEKRYFDRVLNIILKRASVLLGKTLRTHSFRATFITDLLETTSIHEVKDFVGHRHISTTLEYNRSPISIPKKFEISKSRTLKKNIPAFV